MKIPGTLKATPDDFVVDELPLYEPSGEGTHVYVRFRKRNLTTDQAARALARAAGAEPRETGIAGMKDKIAVTTQTISLATPPGITPAAFEEKVRAVSVEGLEILDVKRHGNKLRTGHLAGNRFRLHITELPPGTVEEVCARFLALPALGVPNAFGEQRFGRDQDNAQRALAWLAGKERAPRDARLRRLQYSALQSAVFNAVLEERVARGDWNVPLEGDVLKKEDSGGLFLCTDVQADRERAAQWEISPTGPIFGIKMNQPTHEPAEIEARAFAKIVTAELDLSALRSLGEGTRRPLRLPVKEVTITPDRGEEPCGCIVEFVLPKGAFATTVVGQIIERREDASPAGSEMTQTPTPLDAEP